MIRSSLIKLGMLLTATGAVLILGWPWADSRRSDRFASPDTVKRTVRFMQAGDRQPDNTLQEPIDSVTTRTTPDPKPMGPVPVESQLDINHSTAQELESLPGIGPVLAQRIIERRISAGEFHSPEDLSKVKGLGPKRIEKLRPLIRFYTASKG